MLAGIGLGLSFVPMTIAATTDVPSQQAGLASGLINTSRQVGGAVGLAVMATVAAGASSPTAGYDRAFWITAAALVVGAALALALPRQTRAAERPEAGDAADRGAAARALGLCGLKSVVPCREPLPGFAQQVKRHDRRPRHRRTTMPKYLLLKHYRGGPEPHHPFPPLDQWAPEAVEAHIAFQRHVAEVLRENGEYVGAQALTPTQPGCATAAPTPRRSRPTARTPRRATSWRAGS